MQSSEGQVSVEYLMIIGFIAVITIPLIILYQNFGSDATTDIVTAQTGQIGERVVDSAETVYFLGEPSQRSLKVNMPRQIVGSKLNNGEVVFNVSTSDGVSEIVRSSSVNITGSLPNSSGKYTIVLKAEGNVVKASYS